jgi:hypothetical protein
LILGNLTVSRGIDAQSALVSGGSIVGASGKLSVGDNVNGIVAAVGSITVGQVGNTNMALPYKANDTTDAAVIDAVFSQSLPSSLSPTNLFDHQTLLDPANLSPILANLNSLTVKSGKLVL